MKVYVITSGEYSSYHIDAVFTDEETAWKYASLDFDRTVEIYESDSIKIDGLKKVYFQCRLDLGKHWVTTRKNTDTKGQDRIEHGKETDYFIFYLENTVENYKAVCYHAQCVGDNKLWKIAEDKLAEYAYTVGKSVQDIKNEAVKKIQDKEEAEYQWKMGTMIERLRNAEIHYRIRKYLQEMTDAGLPLPGPDELNVLAERIREDVMKEERTE